MSFEGKEKAISVLCDVRDYNDYRMSKQCNYTLFRLSIAVMIEFVLQELPWRI